MSNLVKHADRELRAAGLHLKSSDYGGMLYKTVMRLVRVHAKEGHSGFSHSAVMHLFNLVGNFKPLTPLTRNPAEWQRVEGNQHYRRLWQSTRDFSCFSADGGKHYYDIDESGKKRKIHKSVEAK